MNFNTTFNHASQMSVSTNMLIRVVLLLFIYTNRTRIYTIEYQYQKEFETIVHKMGIPSAAPRK